jgi:hypothetical protein
MHFSPNSYYFIPLRPFIIFLNVKTLQNYQEPHKKAGWFKGKKPHLCSGTAQSKCRPRRRLSWLQVFVRPFSVTSRHRQIIKLTKAKPKNEKIQRQYRIRDYYNVYGIPKWKYAYTNNITQHSSKSLNIHLLVLTLTWQTITCSQYTQI